MSLLARVQYGPLLPARVGGGMDGNRLKGFAVDKVERYAGAYAFGMAKGYYRDKAFVMGQPIDLVAGAALTVASALFNAYSGGRSQLSPHMERLGDAGLMSYFNSLGAGHGTAKSGRMVAVLPAGSSGSRIAGLSPGASILGTIPQASGGDYLTAEEIAAFSGSR
jgi:hypothetical protein